MWSLVRVPVRTAVVLSRRFGADLVLERDVIDDDIEDERR